LVFNLQLFDFVHGIYVITYKASKLTVVFLFCMHILLVFMYRPSVFERLIAINR